VYLNPLLEESLANSGTLSSNVDGPIALDVTVLRISLDEIISNALKYRRHRTPLQMVARFSSGACLSPRAGAFGQTGQRVGGRGVGIAVCRGVGIAV
jgi:hypothetical protein